MKTKTAFTIGILAGLFIATVFAIGLIFFWQITYAPSAHNSTLPGGTQSPSALQTQVDELVQRVDNLENDQAYMLRDIAWKMDQKLFMLAGIALTISAAAAFFGYRTYKDLDGTIKAKVNATLEKELYQLDPTMLRIWIRKEDGMEKIRRRLELSGLQNLYWFNDFGKHNRKGVTIIPVNNPDAEKEYVQAIKNLKPDPTQAAFILYAPQKGYFIAPETLDAYENSATANMPSTVINAILAVGRGLKIVESAKET